MLYFVRILSLSHSIYIPAAGLARSTLPAMSAVRLVTSADKTRKVKTLQFSFSKEKVKVIDSPVRRSLSEQEPSTGSHMSPRLQKQRWTPLAVGSGPHVDFPPSSSQSDWVPHRGSRGETHCISTPGSGHRSTGRAGSRSTKLV